MNIWKKWFWFPLYLNGGKCFGEIGITIQSVIGLSKMVCLSPSSSALRKLIVLTRSWRGQPRAAKLTYTLRDGGSRGLPTGSPRQTMAVTAQGSIGGTDVYPSRRWQPRAAHGLPTTDDGCHRPGQYEPYWLPRIIFNDWPIKITNNDYSKGCNK